MGSEIENPITKSAMCKALGWSQRFFDSVPLPRYRIGKRDYYKLSDVDTAIEHTKQEPSWVSSKSRVRRTITSHSRSKVAGIEEARKRIKERMQKRSTQMNAERLF